MACFGCPNLGDRPKTNRDLQPGDKATTNFNGEVVEVEIVARMATTYSQSGVSYSVIPSLKHGDKHTYYDAGWFQVKE
jgi:hypothetical protein